MPNVTGNTHKFESEKVSGQLYVDNEIGFGKLTEVGLDFDETVTFNGTEDVSRVSMMVGHHFPNENTSTSVMRLIAGKDSGDVIKSFEHTKDKQVWEWILDRIDP